MNKKIVFLMSICLFAIYGCEKEGLTVTGKIIGTVEYGQGDCMPVIDYESRVYNDDYNGKIFFVVKDDWDNLGNGDYAQLKNGSINVRVRQGKFAAELPIGTYLVMSDFNVYSYESTITITSKEIIIRNFKFFECTSY